MLWHWTMGVLSYSLTYWIKNGKPPSLSIILCVLSRKPGSRDGPTCPFRFLSGSHFSPVLSLVLKHLQPFYTWCPGQKVVAGTEVRPVVKNEVLPLHLRWWVFNLSVLYFCGVLHTVLEGQYALKEGLNLSERASALHTEGTRFKCHNLQVGLREFPT